MGILHLKHQFQWSKSSVAVIKFAKSPLTRYPRGTSKETLLYMYGKF